MMPDEPHFSDSINRFWDVFIRVLVYGGVLVVSFALLLFASHGSLWGAIALLGVWYVVNRILSPRS